VRKQHACFRTSFCLRLFEKEYGVRRDQLGARRAGRGARQNRARLFLSWKLHFACSDGFSDSFLRIIETRADEYVYAR
jgi:hypothetical protein